MSKGFCFCEYVDPSVTDQVIAGLNDMQIGDRKLVVQRAMVGARGSAAPSSMAPMPPMPPTVVLGSLGAALSESVTATKVLVLLNMVDAEELMDDEEYQDILEEVRSECEKFGAIVSMEIPRPSTDGSNVPGLGKVCSFVVRFRALLFKF